MYILKHQINEPSEFSYKISDESYASMSLLDQDLYRIFTVEDEDMENGHYFPGHELWTEEQSFSELEENHENTINDLILSPEEMKEFEQTEERRTFDELNF